MWVGWQRGVFLRESNFCLHPGLVSYKGSGFLVFRIRDLRRLCFCSTRGVESLNVRLNAYGFYKRTFIGLAETGVYNGYETRGGKGERGRRA